MTPEERETAEILADPLAMAAIAEAEAEIKEFRWRETPEPDLAVTQAAIEDVSAHGEAETFRAIGRERIEASKHPRRTRW